MKKGIVLTRIENGIVGVLRINNYKGYMAYLWVDANDTFDEQDAEENKITLAVFYQWAIEQCEQYESELYSY